MDSDNGHLEQSDSGGDSTEPEGCFQNLGVEPCTLIKGVTLGEKQEECTGREQNSELSNMNDRPSQSDDTGTGGPGDETDIWDQRVTILFFSTSKEYFLQILVMKIKLDRRYNISPSCQFCGYK
jgi:hypothetical protein